MYEFWNEVSRWVYLLAAIAVVILTIFVAIRPVATMRFLLRKNRKPS